VTALDVARRALIVSTRFPLLQFVAVEPEIGKRFDRRGKFALSALLSRNARTGDDTIRHTRGRLGIAPGLNAARARVVCDWNYTPPMRVIAINGYIDRKLNCEYKLSNYWVQGA